MLFVISFLLFLTNVYSHGRLTNPVPRLRISDGGINAPVYTCLGPIFKTSQTSMRCHDSVASSISATYNAGDFINLQWTMEAPHPGDCSIWLSYDNNVDSPLNWIKLKDIPGCLAPNGIDTISGSNSYSFKLPEFLPSCEHCVLRWEWYTVQQVSNVEFYVNCVDIKIINNINDCSKPGPTTQINGIEHLIYNLKDATQSGCPFYNVYDVNLRPPINKRSRGPLEWVPVCDNNPNIPTLPVPPVIIYPCSNINCGQFGTCSNGVCICKNEYTGRKCEIPPPVKCDINCNTLNRKTCNTDNICGNCKTGFNGIDNGNTLCKIECIRNCSLLNRRGCTKPNTCGVCLPNFTEPTSKKKSDSCVKTIGDSNIGEISLSISAQWDSGFCGRWITKCPLNRLISFIVPSEISDVRGWNMLNMEKVYNKITGYCANWVITGNDAYGGFCSSFPYGKTIIANKNGYFFQNQRFRNLLENNIMDSNYQNVSMIINVQGDINYDSLINDLSSNIYGNSDITILNDNKNDANTELSLKINCKSRQQFDSALFVHVPELGSTQIDQNLFYKDPIYIDDEDRINSSNKIKLNLYLFYLLFLIAINLFN